MSADRKANFKRIAEARTNKIIGSIALLGNLSNRSYYDYSDKQVDAMFDAIQAELDEQRKRFKSSTVKPKKFRL